MQKWLGHVLCMDKNRTANIALHGRIEVTTKREISRITWMILVFAKYNIGPQILFRIVQDRDRWHFDSYENPC